MDKKLERSILRRWHRVRRRLIFDTAFHVTRYCVGHSVEEVANWIGKPTEWVNRMLELVAMANAIGEESARRQIPVGQLDYLMPVSCENLTNLLKGNR